jgi:cytochrome c-type biogenesis protein CcmH/NrfG
MRRDSLFFGLAGVFFGLLAGWIVGSSHDRMPAGGTPTGANAQPSASSEQRAPQLDEKRAAELKAIADKSPSDAGTRIQLGNLYFDSERYDDAIRWYEDALRIEPRNVNASTDLGIVYYYTNQPDRALAQFDKSLKVDPAHAKTLFNVGIVRAMGKQDLDGAAKAWQRLIEVSPDSTEGREAKRMLEALRSAHPGAGQPAPPPGKSSD